MSMRGGRVCDLAPCRLLELQAAERAGDEHFDGFVAELCREIRQSRVVTDDQKMPHVRVGRRDDLAQTAAIGEIQSRF